MNHGKISHFIVLTFNYKFFKVQKENNRIRYLIIKNLKKNKYCV